LFKFKALQMHIEDKYEYKPENRRMMHQRIKVTLNQIILITFMAYI